MARNVEVKIKAIAYKIKRRKVLLAWQVEDQEPLSYYVIYKSGDISNPENIIGVTAGSSIRIKLKSAGIDPWEFRMTAVDRYLIESQPVRLLNK